MHLSSITIKGFKSFPERTRLVFSPGVSVIVGPNGCGKSNITDAVLWALGEQSPLAVRGQTMQDMIFAGGEGESPRRYAEIEVVLDNADGAAARSEFSEISISRRLDRHGEGEYRINGARCRLVDVIEVLADANLGREMHSVISQGRVEEIVHSRPRERRLLVEEAAGLGKHRKRRRRAQLKLERTRDNLDRALDVEREARTRLRPLRRQAQAADIHARLEREAQEIRASLLADELRAHSGELDEAEREAAAARRVREAVERELATVNARRSAIEERLAERDRERTAAWGRLTAVGAAHERLSVRAEAISGRRAELAAELARHRAAPGALGGSGGGEGTYADSVDSGLDRVQRALEEARGALARAREAPSARERAAEVARVRGASERAARAAHRVEGLLGPRQDSLDPAIGAMAELLARLGALLQATAEVRDAVGERAEALERGVRDEGDADEVGAGLRACSEAEAELQTRLHAAGDSLTEAEVRAAQLRDRRAEVSGELEAIAGRLGREIDPATETLSAEDREEIEGKLKRLRRRREALGSVNPLAEQEYSQALEHVRQLEEQRQDLEAALAELEGLIRETDRKIRAAFEETFEATQRNFEDLIEHLFPGGRGRLRLVGERGPRLVLGGGQASGEGDTDMEPSGAEAAASGVEDEDPAGVEIEVTPAGKATRRLSLLSGGEKALVALAFVFAVFLARPSPFYILDEVEAALDDANIDRFLHLVRRFAGRAQFVIVTHQKRTMDAADVLYGVSMGKGGISKVISRRLSQDSESRDPAGAAEAA
ncbi:MAG TPA: AAA family ATPase [Solirubrobacterales bacterium]|nr:AAA family ATPase [Solirubrobacterales bacterium]